MSNTIAMETLKQLGGNKFLVMTGSKNLLSDGNKLHMNLVKNQSKANKLTITLNDNDTYTMKFFKFTNGRMDKNFKWHEPKETIIKEIEGIYDVQLQEIFTDITGMDTHL